VTGLEHLPRSGLALEAKPFLLGNATQTSDPGGALSGAPEVGLDLKYQVRPGLTLDLTANTDFAQVEVDSQQVNLTRFDLFFPEKRDFFLENAGIFEFGQRLILEPPVMLLFFSRRIGIDEDGEEELPILGGARLTGRVGGQTVGLLDVVTDSAVAQSRTNYAVARVKRDIGGNSYVGAMVTDVRPAGGLANTAGGLDASFWPTSLLNVQTFYARTATDGPGGDGSAYRLGWDYQTDGWGLTGSAIGVSPDAQADLGFIGRTDMRRYEAFTRTTQRPGVLGLRKIDLFAFGNLITRWDGRLQDRGYGPGVGFEWESGESLNAYGLRGFTRLEESFDLSDTVTVDPGDYGMSILGWFASTAGHRPVVANSSGTLMWTWGGRLTTAQASLSFLPNRHVRLDAGGTRTWVRLPNGSFTADLVNLRLSYAFSTRVALYALAQYSSLDRSVSANIRLNVIHRPGSDLYLVFNELRGSDASPWDFDRRAAIVKLTYLARF
jgi:hypothetical protein